MREFLFTIFVIIQAIVALYFLEPVILLLIHFFKKIFFPFVSPVNKPAVVNKDFDFAAIVTAHEDERFIKPIVDSLLRQQYPNFHVYVVADACDVSTLLIHHPQVTILRPLEPLHNKTKSIKYAVDQFVKKHDAMVIFDSDNLVHPDYMFVLNKYFQQGYRAVQTNMLSKNTQTAFAKLDSMGHVYHTFISRKMRMQLGCSSHILGLGIAIECDLYKEVMYKDGLGGFDKKLQADVVKRIPQLAFAEEAIVYDEKVDDGKTMDRQRTRWVFAYFHYFKQSLQIFWKGIATVNFNLLYFGFSALRPPLTILGAAAFLFLIADFFIAKPLFFGWLAILFLQLLAFVWIVIFHSTQSEIKKGLVYLPHFAWSQIKALLRIKSAGRSFLKTEHSRILYIQDILK